MAAGQTVHAHQGETLDALVWRVNGGGAAVVEAVLAANPGLAGLGPFLPEGRPVTFPAGAAQSADPLPLVNLWD